MGQGSEGAAAEGGSTAGDGGGAARAAPPAASSLPLNLLLAALGGTLAFLGYAGFELWPLAFVCFVPGLLAVERVPARQVLLLGLVYGTVSQAGGYYWLVGTLRDFSAFPLPLCLFFFVVLCAFQGGKFALVLWLWRRGRDRGYPTLLTLPAALAASEIAYPLLFPFYMGNALHRVAHLVQIADLGGPILVSMLLAVVNAALYDVAGALRARQRLPRREPALALLLVVAAAIYGGLRIRAVEAEMAEAPRLRVGIVQVNMGIFEKSAERDEGLRRHLEQTQALEASGPLDLVVWPESAFNSFLPTGEPEAGRYVTGGKVRSPLLFGGLRREGFGAGARDFNSAFLLDADGRILGSYDKTYLLYFGERLPFGELFPSLYDLSPRTGHFTAGSHTRPLELGPYRLTTLVCYEDILPAFVRRAVASADPHLLVNVTNDAWFGDTVEPWIHLALAESRAIEHRRFLVRATNSGVSAIVDPLGRVVLHGGVFTRESLAGEVRMLTGRTVYGTIGDLPGWAGLGGALLMAFRRRRHLAAGER